jgi:hypothetical protein
MDSTLVATWIVTGITVLSLIGAIMKNAIDVSNRFVKLEGDVDNVGKDIKRIDEHNTKQHEELYTSRNGMSEAITRLSTLIEVMAIKQDTMDKKIDKLLERKE